MNRQGPDTNYRSIYGKLYAALTRQYGIQHCAEIEDAIQNSFLKSLKQWRPDRTPEMKEDWLYITAKNDLLNQLKRNNKLSSLETNSSIDVDRAESTDLRLETILLIASARNISKRAKIVFVLKSIFGLSVQEIADNTLLGHEAVYKMMRRAKRILQEEFKGHQFKECNRTIEDAGLAVTEEILYAVFNTGFDSFSEKHRNIINKDLCLESLALAKLLLQDYTRESTSNLLALFSFHLARLDAKVVAGELISFMEQDRDKWNTALMQLGFHYLKKPKDVQKFYIEALMVGKYMSTQTYSMDFWKDMAKLYEILLQLSPSPIIELNYSYCLYKAQRMDEALQLVQKLKGELSMDHVYLSLIKASFLKEAQPEESERITNEIIVKMNQDIRKRYVLDNKFINL